MNDFEFRFMLFAEKSVDKSLKLSEKRLAHLSKYLCLLIYVCETISNEAIFISISRNVITHQ